MSFCFGIKNELADIRPPKRCKGPLIYGLLLFGRSFSYKKIAIQSNNLQMVEYYKRMLKEVYGIEANLYTGGSKTPTYRAVVENSADRLRILASMDYGVYEGPINFELLSDTACESAFIRGAFLSCGNISDPEKEYRADFSVKDEALAQELKRLLEKHFVTASVSKRGNGYVVYIKRSEMLINLLTVMGLSDRSLELIETTIVKGVKNNINRVRNCEDANISKTVEASINQRKAIEYLKKRGALDALSEELQLAANLRLDNPEASLKELCKLSKEPITVSGLNHRLRRIIDIYKEIKK